MLLVSSARSIESESRIRAAIDEGKTVIKMIGIALSDKKDMAIAQDRLQSDEGCFTTACLLLASLYFQLNKTQEVRRWIRAAIWSKQ